MKKTTIQESHLRKLIREELAVENLRRTMLKEGFDPEVTARDMLKVIKSTNGDLGRAADQIEMMMQTASQGYDTEELRALYRPLVSGARALGIDVDANKNAIKKILLVMRGN